MMEEFVVDMGGVKSTGFYVEPGTYTAKVVDMEKEMGKSYPYIIWHFEIVGQNTKLKHNTSLDPKALFNLKNVLEALGLTVPEANIKVDPKKLVGRMCKVDVADKEYEGNTYSNIVKFKKITSTPTEVKAKTAPVEAADTGTLAIDDL